MWTRQEVNCAIVSVTWWWESEIYANEKGQMDKIEDSYICVKDEDEFWEKVYYRDIYYIETIKSTHYCRVVHKNGEGKLHGDIKPLEQETGGYFLKVKASTLVNISLIWKIHMEYRMIYFREDIYCTYAKRMNKQLKEIFKIQSFRKKGKKKDGSINRN